MEEKEKILLLFSGGYDSTVLLYMALELGYEIHLLLINYGQVHIEELGCAHRIINYLKADAPVFITELTLDTGVKAKLTQEEGEVQYPGVSEWHVPSRNLMFISLAAGIAESKGISQIWYGANYEDREHQFPDCYQEWVYKVNQLLEINGSVKITVAAPLLGMSKELIKGLGKWLGIDETKVYSGYGDR